MPISINQIAVGSGLLIDGEIFLVLEHQHVKPGKGGAFARVRLKNVKTAQTLDRTIKSADKVEEVPLDERKLQHQYHTDEAYHFMDLSTYEQVEIPQNIIGDAARFMQESLEVTGLSYNGSILKIELPIFITAEIIHTEPGLKGDSSKAGNKPATIDTGTTVQVPLFINIGDLVKIDTRTGLYVERVQR